MTITCDTIIKMDDKQLMLALDKVQPRWAIEYSSTTALKRFASKRHPPRALPHYDSQAAEARWAWELRKDALDRMKETLWLLGHAALQDKLDEAAQAQERA